MSMAVIAAPVWASSAVNSPMPQPNSSALIPGRKWLPSIFTRRAQRNFPAGVSQFQVWPGPRLTRNRPCSISRVILSCIDSSQCHFTDVMLSEAKNLSPFRSHGESEMFCFAQHDGGRYGHLIAELQLEKSVPTHL